MTYTRSAKGGGQERAKRVCTGVVALTAHSEGGVLEKVLVASQVVQLDVVCLTQLLLQLVASLSTQPAQGRETLERCISGVNLVKCLDVEQRTDARRVPAT
jgi:hypothetical protein